LGNVFGMKTFPPLSDESLKNWAPYPGLSAERAKQLAENHAHIKRSIGYRVERSALLARQYIRRLPMTAWIVPLGRFLLPRHRRGR